MRRWGHHQGSRGSKAPFDVSGLHAVEVVQGDELMGWWSAQELYEEARRGIETLEIYDDGLFTGRGH